MSEPKFIIVVAASAGGLSAPTEFGTEFNQEIDASFFIVLHLSRTGISDFLPHRLKPSISLRCEIPAEEVAIESGHIYMAPPNQQLLEKRGKIILGRGPEENRWCPSVDVLFKSAAAAYSTRVIGVILIGSLDEGTAGMLAIKRSGGKTIVQYPNEAEYPDMPWSVISNMEGDFSISLSKIGEAILPLTQTEPEKIDAPQDVIIESEIAERVVVDYKNIKQIGEKSIYACPDCGGGLWTIHNKGKMADRYRCHIGHSYSEKDLIVKQGEVLQSTLWAGLRIMEGRRNFWKKMEDDHSKRGLSRKETSYMKGEEIQVPVDKMREVLYETQKKL